MFLTSTSRFVFGLTTFFFVTLTGAFCVAQAPEDYSNTPPGPFHQPVAPLPVELGFTQDHASTAAEGFLRGKSAVIQALGNFELARSQADILRQQARWLDRENDLKQTAALVAQKKLWAEARTQERSERNAQRAAGLQLAAEKEATVYLHAYQLSTRELDPKSGAVSWPATLQTEKFASEREQLEELLQRYFAYGEPQVESATAISRSVEKLSRRLRREIGSLPREQYMAAQKFLLGIKYTSASYAGGAVNSRSIVAAPIDGATVAAK